MLGGIIGPLVAEVGWQIVTTWRDLRMNAKLSVLHPGKRVSVPDISVNPYSIRHMMAREPPRRQATTPRLQPWTRFIRR